jgi:hypothetical protein
MVRQLEPLVKISGSTPQVQWRARILLRSAEEADQGIGNNMKHHERSVRNVNDPIVRASYQKLNRDYSRAHDSFISLSNQYNKSQQEAILQLGGDQGWLSPEEVQRKMLAKQEVSLKTRKRLHGCHISRLSNGDASYLGLGGFFCACHAGAGERSHTHEPKHAPSERYIFGKSIISYEITKDENESFASFSIPFFSLRSWAELFRVSKNKSIK